MALGEVQLPRDGVCGRPLRGTCRQLKEPLPANRKLPVALVCFPPAAGPGATLPPASFGNIWRHFWLPPEWGAADLWWWKPGAAAEFPTGGQCSQVPGTATGTVMGTVTGTVTDTATGTVMGRVMGTAVGRKLLWGRKNQNPSEHI